MHNVNDQVTLFLQIGEGRDDKLRLPNKETCLYRGRLKIKLNHGPT
jgi:hypothetical protein